MMTSISGSVGIRNKTQQVNNSVADQIKIIELLSRIEPKDGGKQGVWSPPPPPGRERQCPQQLADAIRQFQEFWRARGELRSADGVVDPTGSTLRKLDALASSLLIGPNSTDPTLIRFRQTNPESKTTLHPVTQQVISPLAIGGLFQEMTQTGTIREFLFEMRKDGAIYWFGVAVPQGTSDFSKVQVFFHPTVVQAGQVHAADTDYPTFSGGWSGSIQRYVEMQGGQLAGARQTVLIVPFVTMAAATGRAPAYMFATRPVETLNAMMTAVRDVVEPNLTDSVTISQIGVSSFSSGIGAMRLFIRTFSNGLIVETTDFDGPYIVSEQKLITRAPGAVGRVFSQVSPTHFQIGWMSFYMASLTSVIV